MNMKITTVEKRVRSKENYNTNIKREDGGGNLREFGREWNNLMSCIGNNAQGRSNEGSSDGMD